MNTTVGANSKVVVKTIVIARDLGKTIELNSGLNADNRVIENPSDGNADGDQVNVAESTTKADKNKNDKK